MRFCDFIADDNHGATRFVAQPEWELGLALKYASFV